MSPGLEGWIKSIPCPPPVPPFRLPSIDAPTSIAVVPQAPTECRRKANGMAGAGPLVVGNTRRGWPTGSGLFNDASQSGLHRTTAPGSREKRERYTAGHISRIACGHRHRACCTIRDDDTTNNALIDWPLRDCQSPLNWRHR